MIIAESCVIIHLSCVFHSSQWSIASIVVWPKSDHQSVCWWILVEIDGFIQYFRAIALTFARIKGIFSRNWNDLLHFHRIWGNYTHHRVDLLIFKGFRTFCIVALLAAIKLEYCTFPMHWPHFPLQLISFDIICISVHFTVHTIFPHFLLHLTLVTAQAWWEQFSRWSHNTQ